VTRQDDEPGLFWLALSLVAILAVYLAARQLLGLAARRQRRASPAPKGFPRRPTMTKIKMRVLLTAAAATALAASLSACASASGAGAAVLNDLQGCDRHYEGAISPGNMMAPITFIGSVKIDCKAGVTTGVLIPPTPKPAPAPEPAPPPPAAVAH